MNATWNKYDNNTSGGIEYKEFLPYFKAYVKKYEPEY